MSSVPGVVKYLATAVCKDHLMIPKSKPFLSNLFVGRLHCFQIYHSERFELTFELDQMKGRV